MFKMTRLITLDAEAGHEARPQLETALGRVAQQPDVGRALLRPTLPGVFNGGDYIWHVQAVDEAAFERVEASAVWRDAVGLLDGGAVRQVETVTYESGVGSVADAALAGGVYRTLLLSMFETTPFERVAQFEAETARMPDYIRSICNWQVSRVRSSTGSRRWTHVWEQDYASIDGLNGAYMMQPYHWGHIDRWFDPESTEWSIDTFLCHTFCGVDRAVITG